MFTRLFNPAISLLQRVSSGTKNALLLLSAILLIIGFSLHSLNYGLSSTIYVDFLLLFLLLWVYFYIANMYSIKASIAQLKETLEDVARGKYNSRINELSASEFDLFLEDGNEMLRSLENKSTFLEEYKRVVDASAPLVKTDVDGHITYVNKAYEKLSGYSMDELLGKSLACPLEADQR